jgi:valyl-tRNA synthetase
MGSLVLIRGCSIKTDCRNVSRTGHDPNDYEIGKRRSLPTINIMNKVCAAFEAEKMGLWTYTHTGNH